MANIRVCLLILVVATIFSCQNDDARRIEFQKKEVAKKENIFKVIDNAWNFQVPQPSPRGDAILSKWGELRLLNNELSQKPKSSIGAFQGKAKIMAKRVSDLGNNIPPEINKPEIRARVTVLTTKIKSIDMFINLQQIPEKKVVELIVEANASLSSLYSQVEEIVKKADVPIEKGESDIIKMRDTTRAVPTIQPTMPNNSFPKRKGKPMMTPD